MNENKAEDRFYDKKIELGTGKCGKRVVLLEFAPEPQHMNESKHLHFTVGSKYQVLERKGFGPTDIFSASDYTFRTVNDKGDEIWVNDKFFIPSQAYLTYDVDGHGLEKFFDKEIQEKIMEVPDIRKIAFDSGVDTESYWDNNMNHRCEQVEAFAADLKTLSGISGISEEQLVDRMKEKCAKALYGGGECTGVKDITEGVVRDEGNPLLSDLDKCLASVGKIFGGVYSSVDPDDIILAVSQAFPGRCISWGEESSVKCMTVDGAKINICYEDAKKVFDGLKDFTSQKTATKITSKLIVKKLKKLF